MKAVAEPITSLEERLTEFRERIETALDELVSEKPATHALLYTAARYSLLSPAKRLRPLLTLAAAADLDGDVEHALAPACALEMIHTYSLIHDDLPCMDDDDLRRGRPTLHKVFPEGQALLAGDYLLTYAFEVVATDTHLSDSQKVALIASLSQGAGGEGMIGGQVIDLLMEEAEVSPTWEILNDMHSKKTAALLMTALDCGAIVADASPAIRTKLRQVGLALGLAFQIVDDILDVTGTEAEIGKPVGSDIRNKKTTAVTLLGLPRAQTLARKLLSGAEQALASLPKPANLLLFLAQKFVNRSH
jgi:geranylgeranyl diphosphate synthase type II